MAAFTPITFVKGSKTTTADSAVEAARLRWEGWLPSGTAAPYEDSFDEDIADRIKLKTSKTALALGETLVTRAGGASGVDTAPLPFFNVLDYGVTRGVPGDAAANTAALAALVADVKVAGGGHIVFPASSDFYYGNLVLDGNFPYEVSGYGATLYAAAGTVGIDVNTAFGGSALGCLVEGLHIKGADTTVTGIRITDCDRTRVRNLQIERVGTGVLLRTTAANPDNGTESSTFEFVQIQGPCSVGWDFAKQGGFGSFMQTVLRGCEINNPTVAAVRFGTGAIMGRTHLDYTAWVGNGGAALDTDVDMTNVTGRIMGELYVGAGGGGVGIRPRANSTLWENSSIECILAGSLNPQVDVTNMATGEFTIYTTSGVRFAQSKGTPTRQITVSGVRRVTQTQPIAALVSQGSVVPGGSGGFVFGTGSAAPDTYLHRPTFSAIPRLDTNAVLAVASMATASRPAANSVAVGTVLYDSTLKKPVWSDGTTWRDATGTAA